MSINKHWEILKFLRYKESSLPQSQQANNQLKKQRIDPNSVDRNNVDLALAVIEMQR